MKRITRILFLAVGVILLTFVLYLAFSPIPARPNAWDAPKSAGNVGPFEGNDRLASMGLIRTGQYEQPEHIVYRDEWLYASMAGGQIIRVRPDGSELEEIVNTGGRPLGFEFDAEGALIIADPFYEGRGGLLRVTDLDGEPRIELLTDSVGNSPILFPDAVVIGENGRIYFTDATQLISGNDILRTGVIDFTANTSSGRVLEFDPVTRETRVIMRDMSFANGIIFSEDGQHLLVNETGKYRVWKIALMSENISALEMSPEAEVIIDNLPGLPDNISRGLSDRIWIGFAGPRNDLLDSTAATPWLRAVMLRLLNLPLPLAEPHEDFSHVFAMDEAGNVLVDLQSSEIPIHSITSVTESEDNLYIPHLTHIDSIGWIAKRDVGLIE